MPTNEHLINYIKNNPPWGRENFGLRKISEYRQGRLNQRPTFRTRPRPAGVNGTFQFLFLRVRDARGYITSDQLASAIVPARVPRA